MFQQRLRGQRIKFRDKTHANNLTNRSTKSSWQREWHGIILIATGGASVLASREFN
jgi:hypothetical protein